MALDDQQLQILLNQNSTLENVTPIIIQMYQEDLNKYLSSLLDESVQISNVVKQAIFNSIKTKEQYFKDAIKKTPPHSLAKLITIAATKEELQLLAKADNIQHPLVCAALTKSDVYSEHKDEFKETNISPVIVNYGFAIQHVMEHSDIPGSGLSDLVNNFLASQDGVNVLKPKTVEFSLDEKAYILTGILQHPDFESLDSGLKSKLANLVSYEELNLRSFRDLIHDKIVVWNTGKDGKHKGSTDEDPYGYISANREQSSKILEFLEDNQQPFGKIRYPTKDTNVLKNRVAIDFNFIDDLENFKKQFLEAVDLECWSNSETDQKMQKFFHERFFAIDPTTPNRLYINPRQEKEDVIGTWHNGDYFYVGFLNFNLKNIFIQLLGIQDKHSDRVGFSGVSRSCNLGFKNPVQSDDLDQTTASIPIFKQRKRLDIKEFLANEHTEQLQAWIKCIKTNKLEGRIFYLEYIKNHLIMGAKFSDDDLQKITEVAENTKKILDLLVRYESLRIGCVDDVNDLVANLENRDIEGIKTILKREWSYTDVFKGQPRSEMMAKLIKKCQEDYEITQQFLEALKDSRVKKTKIPRLNVSPSMSYLRDAPKQESSRIDTLSKEFSLLNDLKFDTNKLNRYLSQQISSSKTLKYFDCKDKKTSTDSSFIGSVQYIPPIDPPTQTTVANVFNYGNEIKLKFPPKSDGSLHEIQKDWVINFLKDLPLEAGIEFTAIADGFKPKDLMQILEKIDEINKTSDSKILLKFECTDTGKDYALIKQNIKIHNKNIEKIKNSKVDSHLQLEKLTQLPYEEQQTLKDPLPLTMPKSSNA